MYNPTTTELALLLKERLDTLKAELTVDVNSISLSLNNTTANIPLNSKVSKSKNVSNR